MEKQQVKQAILTHRVMAIARRIPAAQLEQAAEALYRGGVRLLEVTFAPGSFRDSATDEDTRTAETIARLRARMDGRMCIGAGTVMTTGQVELARQAGAAFLLAPDLCREVVEAGNRAGLVTIPGAMTVTEIADAFRCGADIVKVFPAGVLGSSFFRDVRAPLGDLPLIAVGGVTPATIPAFLQAGAKGFGIGSGMFPRDAMAAGDWATVAANAKQYVDAAHGRTEE